MEILFQCTVVLLLMNIRAVCGRVLKPSFDGAIRVVKSRGVKVALCVQSLHKEIVWGQALLCWVHSLPKAWFLLDG
jgi:hypothetical protein